MRRSSSRGPEARLVDRELGNFSEETSEAWKEIKARFGSGITQSELISIARVLHNEVNTPKITRSCMRSSRVLIKFFHDNWDQIGPHIDKITLLDADHQVVDASRETNDRNNR